MYGEADTKGGKNILTSLLEKNRQIWHLWLGSNHFVALTTIICCLHHWPHVMILWVLIVFGFRSLLYSFRPHHIIFFLCVTTIFLSYLGLLFWDSFHIELNYNFLSSNVFFLWPSLIDFILLNVFLLTDCVYLFLI